MNLKFQHINVKIINRQIIDNAIRKTKYVKIILSDLFTNFETKQIIKEDYDINHLSKKGLEIISKYFDYLIDNMYNSNYDRLKNVVDINVK